MRPSPARESTHPLRLLALALLLLGACHHKYSLVEAPVDGPVLALDGANPNGNDDDPLVAVDAQGTLHVVYLPDRDQTTNPPHNQLVYRVFSDL